MTIRIFISIIHDRNNILGIYTHTFLPILSLLYCIFQSNVISCLTHFRGENGQNLHM